MAKKIVAIRLVENSRARSMCETTMRYDVVLFGHKVSQLYFNTRGYQADHGLPTPDGYSLDIGEVGLSAFKKEVARLNKEFNVMTNAVGNESMKDRQKAVYEEFVSNLGTYTGHQIEASNGATYPFSDRIDEVFFVQAAEEGQPTVKKTLTVLFFTNTAIIHLAVLSGESPEHDVPQHIKEAVLFPLRKGVAHAV